MPYSRRDDINQRRSRSSARERVPLRKDYILAAYDEGRAQGSYEGLARVIHESLTVGMKRNYGFSRQDTQEEQALKFLDANIKKALLVFDGNSAEQEPGIIGNPQSELRSVTLPLESGYGERDYIHIRSGGANYRGWEAELFQAEDIDALSQVHNADLIARYEDAIVEQQERIDELEQQVAELQNSSTEED